MSFAIFSSALSRIAFFRSSVALSPAQHLDRLSRRLQRQLVLAVGQIGVAKAVVGIGRRGIRQRVQLEELDGLPGPAGLQKLVAEQVEGGLRKQDRVRIALAVVVE